LNLQERRLAEDRVVAVTRVRVTAHPLRLATAAALGFDGLEHVGHLPRVVAGPCQDLCAKKIRLSLVFPSEFQEVRAQSKLGSLGDEAACRAADHGAHDLSRERAELKALTLGRLRRAMAERDMGDLVPHDPGDFRFRIARFDHAPVEKHRSARQGEGVDLLLVDHVEGVPERRMRKLRRDCRDEFPTDAFDPLLCSSIVQERQFLGDLRSGFTPDLYVLFKRVLVVVELEPGLSGNENRRERDDTSRDGDRSRQPSSGRARGGDAARCEFEG
jgi:hypothetical protein